jgi:hypothetical protein
MKTTSLLSILALGLILTGCVPSLNPLYTEQDLVFDAALVGTWKSDNDEETWTFKKDGEKSYELKHTDEKGQKATFEAHLVKLDKHLFLDLLVTDLTDDAKLNNLAHMAMAPCHLFFKVHQIGGGPRLSLLDADWISKHLESNPDALKHRKTENHLLLTADTKDLQRFIIEHADNEDAFDKEDALVLKPAPAQAEKSEE